MIWAEKRGLGPLTTQLLAPAKAGTNWNYCAAGAAAGSVEGAVAAAGFLQALRASPCDLFAAFLQAARSLPFLALHSPLAEA